ncbi:PREDICTED: DNA-directed RNA polymerase III subunit RPC5-like [Cyphomyrmex costatus]|uniref:DNA-directed RNA polymerase III subunit RPC5-like n=1 Tax=Cyphomyrmex costatus TaxID=456900 RepID=UPI0008522F51|nr:PREDICTED: DNA-directed RNA polymerase III subunit RPC5-like [Cyphomyrmex costatus]
MDITEIDDPVVKEIPVYLSKTLADKLFIIQYPAYVKDNYPNATFLKTSIKPENQKIRMELSMDTLNKHSYDYAMGKQLALKTSEKSTENDEIVFDGELMDKVVLTSERTLSDCSNFAVGIFQDGELYITPLKTMLQMKLQCDYLDENNRNGMKNTGEDDDEEENNPIPVKVTFARHLPDNVKKLQEQSFQHHHRKSQEERWIHTKYIPAYDEQAESTRMEMFCSSEESINNLNLDQINYLHLLVPQIPDECYLQSTSEDQIDLHRILTLPLLDQIRTIVKQVRVISFAKLCEILSEHDTTTILRYLQQVAMLVQGNWIVNSELIYPKDSLSPQNNTSEFMCRARDYILLLFTEQQYLNRKSISSVIKLPSEEINQIFTELGTNESGKGWKLKEPLNWDFYKRHSEIVQRQQIFWDAKRKHLRETMEAQNQPLQRQRRKSNRESLGSENEERNVSRGLKLVKESSASDNDGAITESAKHKKSRSRKISETT